MSRSNRDRKMYEFSPMSAAIAISAALRRRFGAERHAHKRIARMIGVTPRAARHGWEGTCAPQADDLIALMRLVPEVTDAVLDLAGQAPRDLTADERARCAELAQLLEGIAGRAAGRGRP